MDALIKGGSAETIVAQIRADEEKKRALHADLQALDDATEARQIDAEEVHQQLADAARDVTTLLAGTTAQARQMLRKILAGKITAEPIEQDGQRGFRLTGELVIGRLLPTHVFHAIETVAGNNTPDRGGPNGIRTRVSALRGPCPGPLDDGAANASAMQREEWLGEEDSNPRYVVQSHASYH